MASGKNDGNGPHQSDESDRGLLIGLSEGGEDAAERPGDPPGTDEPPAGIAAALERIDARLGRLEVALEADRQSRSRLSEEVTQVVEAAGRIAGASDAVAEIKRTTDEAARFTHDTKEATNVLHAEAGKQIAGLKEERGDLEKALAALKSRVEGLKAREDALGKGIAELRALWKSVSETSAQLATQVQTLTNNYRSWKSEAAAHRKDMASLSEALLQGDARMAESVSRNAEAQQTISAKTHRTVERFAEENDRLLEHVGAAREDFLDALRAEAGRVRRWVVPALSAALVLAVPSFAAMGGYAQSQFGIFDAYDDTNGWKQFVWDRHGERVRACLLRSEQTGKVLACQLRVDGRGLFREPASRLPPLPTGG
ncbi:MAG: hypothetical protein OXI80_02220 [Caldilineaceae bacterium]|nr:hypothetical protein [Defluviicoccus sp.]MDE0336461.1 hypothetical protein [Caldilineaceae bacterium]